MKKHFIFFLTVFSFTFLNAQDFISAATTFSNAGSSAVLNNKLYAAMSNSITGAELYVIDGITAEPVLVKDINPGTSGSNLSDLITFDNKIYFSADDGVNGQELWVSDGTPAGTLLLKDIFTGNAFSGSFPQYFTILNNKLYFTAATSKGYELWVTDGTTLGTVMVKDVNPDAGFSNARPRFTTVLNNKLYFYAQGGSAGTGIWESDGTNAGTVLAIPDATISVNNNSELGRFIVYNNKMYFNGFIAGGSSYQLYSSDGTIAGTQLVKTINPTGDADIRFPFVYNNTLFFSATDGVNGSELWKTDGTDAGTQLLKEIFVGGGPFTNSSFPRDPVLFNNRVYFTAQDAINGRKIWETKGTEATTKIVDGVFNASSPSSLTVHNNKLYFNTVNGINDGLYVYTPPIEITSTTPTANSSNVLQESNINLTFNNSAIAANVNTNNIKISGSQTGNITGVFSGAGTNQITFNPNNNFKPGETITVTLTNGISVPYTFSFTAKVPFKVTPFQPTDTPLEIATLTSDIIGLERILTGDLNNDGFLDVVALDELKVNWLISSGGANPTYTKYESAATTATSEIQSIKLADINNDGFLDIVTANVNQTVWFQNNGNATTGFTEILVANTGISTGLKLVEVTDLDKDGTMDVLQIDRFGVVTWYKNNGATTPVFTPQIIFDDPNGLLSDFNDLVAKDMDNDGDVDLVFNSFLSTNREIILLENNGTTNPTFTRSIIGGNNSDNPIGNLLVIDINGDGFLDVAFTERTASPTTFFFVWLENNGVGNPLTFTERNDANLTQLNFTLYASADIDGDGDTDFFTIDSNAPFNLIYLENNSTTNPVSFTKVALQNVAGVAANATFGDTDNDGSLDIITLNYLEKVRIFKGSKALNTFLGTTNNLWSTLNNWSFGTLPRPTEEIKIQTATTANLDIAAVVNKITIEGTLHINAGKSLTVTGDVVQNGTFSIQSDATSSGSFMASGTYSGAGKIDYYRYVTDNWHLISVPVDFVLAGNFATNSANNLDFKLESAGGPSYTKYALATYENNLGNGLRYKYYTDFNGPNDISALGPFQRARGYSARRKTAGTYTFTGGFFSDNAIFALDDSSSSGGTKWNLLGNPYTSFIALNMEARLGDNFLTLNGANLDPARVAVYLWNANTASYDIINHATGTAKYAAPGQGFFVQAKDGASTLASFSPAMQSVHEGDFFLKSESVIPEINLTITTNGKSKSTQIKYLENTTTGLDIGYDAGSFNDTTNTLDIFTHLVTESTGTDFALQCLPNRDFETMIIPVGINTKANSQFTISSKSVNLNEGLYVFLEDRENNTFTNLSKSDFSMTTKTALKGVGRFFLHTSSNALSTDTVISDMNISLYKKDSSTLTILGLYQSVVNLQLVDILGKTVFTTNFIGIGKNDVLLPNLKLGVYLVSIKTNKGNINKKIILD